MESPKKEGATTKTTNFAKLDDWYKDSADEIKKIRAVGVLIFDNPNNIKPYFSLIYNLFSTHSSYIDDNDNILIELDKIKKTIYSKDFGKKLVNGKDPNHIYYVIDRLMKIFTKMNKSFSNCGISPQVQEVKQVKRR